MKERLRDHLHLTLDFRLRVIISRDWGGRSLSILLAQQSVILARNILSVVVEVVTVSRRPPAIWHVVVIRQITRTSTSLTPLVFFKLFETECLRDFLS